MTEEEINDLNRGLGRIEGKLNQFLEAHATGRTEEHDCFLDYASKSRTTGGLLQRLSSSARWWVSLLVL